LVGDWLMVTQAKTSLWHHKMAKIWSANFRTGFYRTGQKERESLFPETFRISLPRGDTCWCMKDMKKWILHNRWPLTNISHAVPKPSCEMLSLVIVLRSSNGKQSCDLSTDWHRLTCWDTKGKHIPQWRTGSSYRAAGSTCGISPSWSLPDSRTAAGGASHTLTRHRPAERSRSLRKTL